MECLAGRWPGSHQNDWTWLDFNSDIVGRVTELLTLTNAPESRMICLMLAPPAPMIAPTAELGTLICNDSLTG